MIVLVMILKTRRKQPNFSRAFDFASQANTEPISNISRMQSHDALLRIYGVATYIKNEIKNTYCSTLFCLTLDQFKIQTLLRRRLSTSYFWQVSIFPNPSQAFLNIFSLRLFHCVRSIFGEWQY